MTTVETLFIDGNTGKVIAQADMPAERLPQSFAPATTLHLGDEDWQVVSAEPTTAEEFVQTGKLVLTLKKVVKVPVKDILFTLPTLCNEIPALLPDSTREGKQVLELHEDDWRQIEFVSLIHRHAIDAELAGIRTIYQEASVNNGHVRAFKRIHLRHITTPFLDEIRLEHFFSFFTSAFSSYDGIAYQGSDGLVDGGFAFSTVSVLFYGQQVEGVMKVLGIKMRAPAEHMDIAHSLQRFMKTYDLCLMDWCALQLVLAQAKAISAFLAGKTMAE